MAEVKPIRTEADYAAALARIDELMDAEQGSPEGDELDVLADLVEAYENRHVPIDYPSPIAAIEFRMDQAGLTPRDLVPFIGSRAKVSEVLSGKRPITMPMARALHEHLGIPAEVLLQEPGAAADQPEDDIQWRRFPLKEMAKRNWIPAVPNPAERAEDLIRGLITRAGGWQVARAALYARTTTCARTPRPTRTLCKRGVGKCWRRPTTTCLTRRTRPAPSRWIFSRR